MRKAREVLSVTLEKAIPWSSNGGSKIGRPEFEIELGDHWVDCTETGGKRRTFSVHVDRVKYVEYAAAPAKVKAA
ncbi:MAG TPA: hypothetical protein VFZ21_31005 [Gemmatimonadaceae bacterium]|nr:hypothetical protein [Gemmatimonadaceae bacterium]